MSPRPETSTKTLMSLRPIFSKAEFFGWQGSGGSVTWQFFLKPILMIIKIMIVIAIMVSGGLKGGAPEGGAPEGVGPKISRAFFFPSPTHNFLSFFPLLGVFSWNFGGGV